MISLKMGIVWRCQDYKISKHAVHKRLERIAEQRGLPLTITRKQWHLDSRVSDEQAQSEELRKDGLPYETSLLHNAFSVARMSLQDRHYIRSIVESLGENASGGSTSAGAIATVPMGVGGVRRRSDVNLLGGPAYKRPKAKK